MGPGIPLAPSLPEGPTGPGGPCKPGEKGGERRAISRGKVGEELGLVRWPS